MPTCLSEKRTTTPPSRPKNLRHLYVTRAESTASPKHLIRNLKFSILINPLAYVNPYNRTYHYQNIKKCCQNTSKTQIRRIFHAIAWTIWYLTSVKALRHLGYIIPYNVKI